MHCIIKKTAPIIPAISEMKPEIWRMTVIKLPRFFRFGDFRRFCFFDTVSVYHHSVGKASKKIL
jgi:hypothetical protein